MTSVLRNDFNGSPNAKHQLDHELIIATISMFQFMVFKKKVHDNKFIIILFFIGNLTVLINDYVISILNDRYWHYNSNNPLEGHSIADQILSGIILYPLMETALFQLLPYYIAQQLKLQNSVLLISLSAIAFASIHLGNNFENGLNFGYALATFIPGALMMYLFIEAQKRTKYPFLITFIFHSFHNLLAFLL